MTKTLRTLGLAAALLSTTGVAGYAAMTKSDSSGTVTTSPNSGENHNATKNTTGNGQADRLGNTTAGSNTGPSTVTTGDNQVGARAPSAGGKVGGGEK